MGITQRTVYLCLLPSSDFALCINVDGLDYVLGSRNILERESRILCLSKDVRLIMSPWHKCIHFYKDQDVNYDVSPCTQRSKYFLIIIQADSQRFVFQFIRSNLPEQIGKFKFPFLDWRAIVPVKTVRIEEPKAAASDGTEPVLK